MPGLTNAGQALHTPDPIVHYHCLLGSASDGIVVLEEAQVAPCIRQHGVVREWVLAVHAGMAGMAESQAVQDLGTTGGKDGVGGRKRL